MNEIEKRKGEKNLFDLLTHTHTSGGGNEIKFKATAIERILFSRISHVAMIVQFVHSVYLISILCAIFTVVAIDSTTIEENCPAKIENVCRNCARFSFFGQGEWNWKKLWVIWIVCWVKFRICHSHNHWQDESNTPLQSNAVCSKVLIVYAEFDSNTSKTELHAYHRQAKRNVICENFVQQHFVIL